MAMQKEVTGWITVNGKHVPIFEGESKQTAYNRAVAKHNESVKNEQIAKNKKEVADKNSSSNNAKSKHEKVQTFNGYILRQKDTNFPNKDRYIYVSKVKKDGTYEYTTDYTYAKHFSDKAKRKQNRK